MKVALASHGLPGRLIAACGMDGAGKSTVIRAISEHLNRRVVGSAEEIVYAVQPSDWWRADPRVRRTILKVGDGEIADELAIGVFAIADRLNQQALVIQPALESGAIVLMDRYVFSLFSYYMALGEPAIAYLAATAAPLFQPDLTILMDCDPQVAGARVKARDGLQDGRYDQSLPLTTAIMRAFRELAASNDTPVISSMQPEAAMAGAAVTLLSDKLGL